MSENIQQNDITNAMLESVQLLADHSAQTKEATLVVEAEIVKVVDEGLGTYTVKYLNNKFNATAAHTEITYKVGDNVYIVIPNGDFDKNKVILSPVAPSTATYATTESTTKYVPIGDNLFKSVPDVELCTYKPHDANPSGTDPSPIVNIDTTGFSALFQAALKDSRTFNFTCKIQTNIDKSRRSRGNYGLVLDIPVLQSINGESKTKYYSIVMDVNNITGDPYQLSVPALQNFYFSLPKDMDYNEKMQPRIRSFVTGFIGKDNSKPNDIFITDIKLLSTMEVDQENLSGYYSVITATGGNSFLPSRPDTKDVKTLSVTLYLNGKKTNTKDFDCYWFKENIGIDNTNDKFQKFGGLGWEILNSVSRKDISEDGKESYIYVTDVFTQSVSKTEIHCDTKFKCVLVKKESETVISSVVTIRNLNSTAILELTPIDGSSIFPVGIGDVKLELKYKELGITDVVRPNYLVNYYWQRLDKKGNVITFDENIYTIDDFNVKKDNTFYTRLHYPVSEVDETNTIGCTAYIRTTENEKVVEQTIGTVWLTISTGQIIGSRIIVTNGDKLYKYDADGDSPMVADYDGPLSSAIKTIDPISIKIFKEDGSEFTTNEYMVTTIDWLIPINSMIKLTSIQKKDPNTNPGYYTIREKYPNNKELTYSINPTFNKNKLDNTIIIKASAPESVLKETITNVASLKFLKDGESGTNGTKYSAIITYEDYGYGEKDGNGKIHKLQLIYVNNINKWYLYNPAKTPTRDPAKNIFNSETLKVKLYADGELVTNYSPSVQWRIFDSDYSFAEDNILTPIQISSDSQKNGIIKLVNEVKWDNTAKNCCATVEAKVNAARFNKDSGSITSSEEYIYAYYPIECTYVASFDVLQTCVPTIEGGFSKVLYASDGTSPQYDNSENFYVVDPLYNNDIGNFYDYTWQASTNMTVAPPPRDESGKELDPGPTCKVIPRSKYDNSIAKNFVRVQLGRSEKEREKINDLWSQKDAAKKDAEKNKRYYEILEENLPIFKEFDYDYYVRTLSQSAEFLKVKQILFNDVHKLLDLINTIRDLTRNSYDRRYQVQHAGDKLTHVLEYQIMPEISKVEKKLKNLNLLYSKLCFDEGVYDEIIEVKPSSLLFDNKFLLSEIKSSSNSADDITIYESINHYVESYNITVNSYNDHYNDFKNKNKTYEENLVKVFEKLGRYVNDVRLENLAKEYEGIKKEVYRYDYAQFLLKYEYEQLQKQDTTNYSFNEVLNGTIELLQKEIISKYSSFSYQPEINNLQSTINSLDKEIENYKRMLAPQHAVNIIHVKPIIMIYNRYELSNINGWDGNKLKTNDGYLLAPQVGAGKKNNSNNTFTGIVMGVKQVSERTTVGNQKIGLFGYSSGVQSIFLNAENGSATFGLSGAGQVIIEPGETNAGKAIIKSGNYNTSNSNYIYEREFSISSNPKIQGLYEYDAGSNRYKRTSDTEKISGKDYYSATNNRGGMQIDLTTPEIRFGTGNFVVNSAGHITAAGGGSIAGWDINDTTIQSKIDSTKPATEIARMVIYSGATFSKYDDSGNKIYTVNPDNPGKIYTGQHNTLDSTLKGFYLSSEGLSITGTYEYTDDKGKIQTATSRIELNTKKDPVIFTGRHGKLGSTDPGFYLGSNGLSIGTSFTIYASGKADINHEDSSIGQWKIIEDDKGVKKLASSDKEGILLNAPASQIILGGGDKGEIYSGEHTNFNSTKKGFYLSNNGLSIGDHIKIANNDYYELVKNVKNKTDDPDDPDNPSEEGWYKLNSSGNGYVEATEKQAVKNRKYYIKYTEGCVIVGKISESKKWIISGDDDNAYIAYNTTTINHRRHSIYLGTNGISLGEDKFSVTDNGALTSKSGIIGGWTIKEDTLSAQQITIDSKGSISGGYSEEDKTGWVIRSNGEAYFNKIYASNEGTIGGWKITGSELGASKLKLDALNGEITGPGFKLNSTGLAVSGDGGTHSINFGDCDWGTGGFALSKGSIGLGGSADKTGISCSKSDDGYSLTIKGAIYADSGEIGGCSIKDGKLKVPAANITNLQAAVINAIKTSSDITFGGTIIANSLRIGATTYNSSATINNFDSQGGYIGQVTVLSASSS